MSPLAVQMLNAVRSIIQSHAGWSVQCHCCSQGSIHRVERETLFVARTGETRNAYRILWETSANVRFEGQKGHGKMTLKWIEGI